MLLAPAQICEHMLPACQALISFVLCRIDCTYTSPHPEVLSCELTVATDVLERSKGLLHKLCVV